MVTGALDEKLVLGAIAWRDEAPGKRKKQRREERRGRNTWTSLLLHPIDQSQLSLTWISFTPANLQKCAWMCIADFWTQRERERVGWFGRMALKHVYYRVRIESPVYVRCRIQHAWGWCMGMTQGDVVGREVGGGSCLGSHVHPWWIHVNVWQNQYSIVK